MSPQQLARGRAGLRPELLAAGILTLGFGVAAAWLPVEIGLFAAFGVTVAMGGLVTILRPRYLLYLVVLLALLAVPIRGLGSLDLGNTELTLAGVQWAAVAAALTVVLLLRSRRLSVPIQVLGLLIFPVWAFLRLPGSGQDLRGVKDVLFYSLPALLLLTARVVLRDERGAPIRQLGRLLFASVFFALVLYAVSIPLGWITLTPHGPQGLFGPRPTATMLVVVLGLAMAHWRYAAERRGYFALVALLAFGLVLFSASRTASATAILVIVISRLHPSRLAGALPRIAIGLALVLIAMLSVPTLRQRMFYVDPSSITDLGDLRDAAGRLNVSGRHRLWPAVFEHARQRPLVGWGPGSSRLPAAAADFKFGDEYPPHNEYLQVFHDTGILGVALVLWGWIGLARLHLVTWRAAHDAAARTTAQWNLAALLGVFTVLSNAALDNTLHYAFVVGPVIILAACGQTLADLSHGARPAAAGSGGGPVSSP